MRMCMRDGKKCKSCDAKFQHPYSDETSAQSDRTTLHNNGSNSDIRFSYCSIYTINIRRTPIVICDVRHFFNATENTNLNLKFTLLRPGGGAIT